MYKKNHEKKIGNTQERGEMSEPVGCRRSQFIEAYFAVLLTIIFFFFIFYSLKKIFH
jgi:hypothetical protein